MNVPQHKTAIKDALNRFTIGNLVENARNLLNTLDYRSERTLTLESSTAETFIAAYDSQGKLNRDRALTAKWSSIDLLFQLRGVDLTPPDTTEWLFDPSQAQVDNTIIQSYLFFAIRLEGSNYNRTQLSQITREINKLFMMPAMLLFQHGETLTLSIINRRLHATDPSRDVLEKVTLIKDIDFKDPHRAHIDILFDLALESLNQTHGVRNFVELHRAWEKTLDTEELNKQFYRELFTWFEWAVAEGKFPTDKNRTLKPEEHVIRLITRLLFVWFIKEKGLIADGLFTESQISPLLKDYNRDSGDSYYRAVLQNLFFATLNTEIEKRQFSKGGNTGHRNFSMYRYKNQLTDPDKLLRLFEQTPFINGGLFDCLDSEEATRDGGYRVDCFSDEHYKKLSLPNRLFFDDDKGLIPLLKGYKFTVEENTPIEQEVALDPELLGKVFENLLAAYNPETGATARKQTGSYYTPRPIVDYMVEEALTAALAVGVSPTDGDAKFWEERLRYLFDYAKAFDDASEWFDSREADEIVRAISALKILDPAVGSGAFPMGILHKLTLALRRLDPDNTRWEQLQKERAIQRAAVAFDTEDDQARREELLEINETFKRYRDSDFGRKLYLIQNSIFGVDIQAVACQIAKLRFFISLAIEQEPTKDTNNNFGIKPLPNLETRFIAANTLIGLEEERTLTSPKAKALEGELADNRERHFHATTRPQKLACKRADKKLRQALATELKHIGMPADDANKVAAWDPYDQKASADWFDPEWMFGIVDGFDVVIGNPPYVVSKDRQLRKIYSESVYGRPNLYGFFIHRVLQDLLVNKGILTFINPRTLLTDAYCSALRTFVLKHSQISSVLNIADRRNVFEAVLQACIVNSFQNTHTPIPIRVKSIFRKEDISTKNWVEISQDDFLFQRNDDPLFIVGNHHRIYDIFRKLKTFKSFKTHGLSFTTGKIQWDLYKSALGNVPTPIGTRLIWAENVQRYCYLDARKRADKIYINKRLEKYQPIRHDTIIVQRVTAVEQPRRIIAHLFSPDSFGCPIQAENHTSYLAEAKDIHLKFVLGILNSKFIDFIFRHLNSNTQVSAGELNALPFPDSEDSIRESIINFVDQILDTKRTHPKEDVSALEDEIDRMVYLLYKLTPEEIAIVEEV